MSQSLMRVVHIPERYTLTVVMPGPPPRAVAIEGRVAKLIAWLISHRGRVEGIGLGALVFNMGLDTFQPEIKESFPRQNATPDDPDSADTGGLVSNEELRASL